MIGVPFAFAGAVLPGRAGLTRIGIALPPLLVVWVVWDHWPLVPIWDQWALVPFFEKVASGEATLADFVARHEVEVHHIIVPRLIFTALAFASDWTMKLEVWGSLLLAAATLWALLPMARAGLGGRGALAADVAAVFVSLLVFSLVQIWNWLWGFSLMLFLINACLVIGIEALRSAPPHRFGLALVVAGTCCFLASFSMAHGVLTWVAVAPAVLFFSPEASRRRMASVWTGMTLVTWALYLWGYSAADAPTTGGLLGRIVDHPLLLPGYFLIVLGSPLAWASDLAGDAHVSLVITACVGLAVLVAALLLFVRLFVRLAGEERRAVVAWGCIGLFSILYAGLNTVGRAKPFFLDPAGYDLARAWLSMYATPAGLLTIATMLLAARALVDIPRTVGLVASSVLAVVIVANDAVEIEAPEHLERDPQTLCFELMAMWAPANTCMNLLSHADEIAALERIGWRSPREGLVIEDARAAGRVIGYEAGRNGGAGVLTGEIDPSPPLAAAIAPSDAGSSAVLLSASGTDRFFAYALIDDRRAESAGTDAVAWQVELDPRATSRDLRAVQAWLYARASGRIVPLGEPYRWSPPEAATRQD